MDEQVNQPTGEIKQAPNNILPIILTVIITAVVIGGSIYFWQNQKMKNLQYKMEESQKQLQQQIVKIQKEKMELDKKYCKGVWKDEMCVITLCVDSDVNEKPNDVYIKGSTVYTDENGVTTTVNDECSGSKKQVNEMWCYNSPQGSGNYVAGTMVYDCPNGCLDGACIK